MVKNQPAYLSPSSYPNRNVVKINKDNIVGNDSNDYENKLHLSYLERRVRDYKTCGYHDHINENIYDYVEDGLYSTYT